MANEVAVIEVEEVLDSLPIKAKPPRLGPHEVTDGLDVIPVLLPNRREVKVGERLPYPSPALREQAHPCNHLEGQEAKDVVEDIIGEVADVVDAFASRLGCHQLVLEGQELPPLGGSRLHVCSVVLA